MYSIIAATLFAIMTYKTQLCIQNTICICYSKHNLYNYVCKTQFVQNIITYFNTKHNYVVKNCGYIVGNNDILYCI